MRSLRQSAKENKILSNQKHVHLVSERIHLSRTSDSLSIHSNASPLVSKIVDSMLPGLKGVERTDLTVFAHPTGLKPQLLNKANCQLPIPLKHASRSKFTSKRQR